MADGTVSGAPQAEPHNIEAEQALLGALLLNNEVLDRVSGILGAHHFYDPVHGRIFEIASERITRGNHVSPVTLKAYLSGEPGFDELGGPAYLVRLAEATVSILAARDYAVQIRDLAFRRELMRIGLEIRDRATRFDADDEPSEQITAAEQALYSLAEKGRYEGGFKSFAKAVEEAALVAEAAFKRGGGLAGLSSGLQSLDDRLGGFRKSDLVILAGRPSMGKTALATNIAFDIARRYRPETDDGPDAPTRAGGVVGFFSLEMSSEQLANRILSGESGLKGPDLLSGRIDEEDFKRFVRVAQELETAPLYIDDTPALAISTLAARARKLKRTKGLHLLVVDYLQLLRPARGISREENRVQELSSITQGLKAIAKELDIPVLALSQLSRQVEAREDKRPQLSDLRESGSIEQDADVVMFVFREEYYHERQKPAEDDPRFPEWQQTAERLHGRAEVILGKQRHGPIGTVNLHFEGRHTRFSDPVRPPAAYGDGGELR